MKRKSVAIKDSDPFDNENQLLPPPMLGNSARKRHSVFVGLQSSLANSFPKQNAQEK